MSTDVVVINTGFPGPIGPPGIGAPPGGTANQVLAKIDSTNYNTQWLTVNLAMLTENSGNGFVDFGAWPGQNTASLFVPATNIQAINAPIVSIDNAAQGTYTASDIVFLTNLVEILVSPPVPGVGFTITLTSTERIQGQIPLSFSWV